MTTTIALILRALAGAVSLKDVFGGDVGKLAPVLNTVAALAEVPDFTRAQQEALLAQVKTWVAENRGPTDAELDAFKDTRDVLDQKLKAALAALEGK